MNKIVMVLIWRLDYGYIAFLARTQEVGAQNRIREDVELEKSWEC